MVVAMMGPLHIIQQYILGDSDPKYRRSKTDMWLNEFNFANLIYSVNILL